MHAYSRAEAIEASRQVFDVVIIGGGSTGAAIAREVIARGFTAVLLERGDFASGTSSRSTKLLHGGVRYLEKAFKSLSKAQFNLVKEALSERAGVMKLAPHLCRRIPILIPLYRWWHLPYYYGGLALYDFLSGRQSIGRSRVLLADATSKLLPHLRRAKLKGSVLYYDGQFDDARLNVEVILGTLRDGLVALSYAEVLEIEGDQFNSEESIPNVLVRDRFSLNEWRVKGRVIINAAGPFVDALRKPEEASLVQGSSGAHIVVNGDYTPCKSGMLIPKTSDDRVLFMLPWKGKTLIGTTDNSAKPVEHPVVAKADIQFIVDQINGVVSKPLQLADVLSAWVGFRPLIASQSHDTKSIVREHLISISGKVVTVTGGKWTTFLEIARDVIRALGEAGLLAEARAVSYSLLPGAQGYEKLNAESLCHRCSLGSEIVQELVTTFGGRAEIVIERLCQLKAEGLDEDRAFFAASAWYAARYEAAMTIEDVLARRLRTAFLDIEKANTMAKFVARAMAEVHGWSSAEQDKQVERWRNCYQRALSFALHDVVAS
jgi:glycerol-3-phosphate dehydrogenase